MTVGCGTSYKTQNIHSMWWIQNYYSAKYCKHFLYSITDYYST